MKSKLTRYIPLESISVPAELYSLEPTDKERDEEKKTLQQETTYLLQNHIALVAAETVENGSVVYLNLTSAVPRFNREKVPVTVGLGLFSQELETILIGKKAGEIFETLVNEDSVRGTILSVQNRVVPSDPTSLTYSLDLDGADNYENWLAVQKRKALDRRRGKRLRSLYQYVTMQMNERCQPQFDSEELESMVETAFQDFLQQFGQILGSVDNLDPQMKASYLEQVKGSTEWTLADALFGQAMGAAPCPDGEDEILYYSQAFRGALHQYCEGLLDMEEAKV